MQSFVQSGTLGTGLETTPALESPTPSLRVSWIRWDSGFRASGLKVGDHIIGVNGQALSIPSESRARQQQQAKLIGQYQEPDAWQAAGAKEGDAVTLRIHRRRAPGRGWEELDIRGSLRSACIYQDDANRRTLGPSGPGEWESDGFSGGWSGWYEKAQQSWRRYLDQGVHTGTLVTDFELKQHTEHEPRVRYLAEKYPGPLSQAALADWESVRQVLAGRSYTPGPDALTYRRLGEQRAQDVREAGQVARAAYLQAHAPELISPFPAVDPVQGDRAKVIGKLVELPVITQREWISQGVRTCFVFEQGNDLYFADGESRGMERLLRAQRRYERAVNPYVRTEYAIIGRILPDPGLVVLRDRGRFALKIEPVAGSVGDAFFVDIESPADPVPFAGEEELHNPTLGPLPDDATPEAVIALFFEALKMGEQSLWQSLFANWSIRTAENGLPVVNPGYLPSTDSTWTDARAYILNRVCDVRVFWVDDPQPVVSGKHFDGAPLIEETLVEVDHYRIDGDIFRSFCAVGLHRYWTLQRIDGGPWRITSIQGI